MSFLPRHIPSLKSFLNIPLLQVECHEQPVQPRQEADQEAHPLLHKDQKTL